MFGILHTVTLLNAALKKMAREGSREKIEMKKKWKKLSH